MKVLFCNRPSGAFGYITDGMYNAMKAAGHTVGRWDGKPQSWANFAPDLYCGSSGHRQPIPSTRTTKIALHVNPYTDEKIVANGVTINEAQHAIDWTVAQRPDLVFGYGHETDRRLWCKWTINHGIEWVPMPTAGDSTLFQNLDLPRDIDFGYIGGYWKYKANNIDKYLMPLAKACKSRIKIHGRDWPHNAGATPIDDDAVVGFYNRIKIAPCIAEPHTTEWGIDLPERLWKASLCGAVVVHDHVKGLERYMPSVVTASTTEEYIKTCQDLTHLPNAELASLAERQRSEVLKSNTYFRRMAVICDALGFHTESQALADMN